MARGPRVPVIAAVERVGLSPGRGPSGRRPSVSMRRRNPKWNCSSTESPGDYSGRCWDPDVSAGEFGEDVEGSAAVLGRGGQVGAHRGEVLGAGQRAQAAGHLLLDLDHPDVAFGRVVVERNPQVNGEPQVVIQAPAD